MYILLVGEPPFNGNNDAQIRRSVLKGKFSFKSEPKISDDAQNLIKKLLTYNPKYRISAR